MHLGQEDLENADLRRLSKSSVRLGISTHSLAELGRAMAFRPSYVALGPIYPTTAKPMNFHPQGMETLKLWRSLVDIPLVAIGGINLKDAPALFEAGADGVAVISDLKSASDWEARAQAWLQLEVSRKG